MSNETSSIAKEIIKEDGWLHNEDTGRIPQRVVISLMEQYHKRMMDSPQPTEARELPKCEAGCKIFEGGEIKHHEDCVFYPESLTKLNADKIASQQSEITRMKAELEEVSIWIQLNGWQFSTVFASKDSAWINPKTNEVKSFTELYTLYQSQKQKP